MPILLLLAIAAAARAQPLQPVGERDAVDPADLPAPYATDSVSNRARVVARPAGARLAVPAGFASNLFHDDLSGPRWMTVASNGDVLLTETRAGRIRVLRDGDGDGRAEIAELYSDDIPAPHGLALHGGYLYVSSPAQLYRFPYRPGDVRPRGPAEPVLKRGALGDGGGHWTRNLAVSRDGKSMFIAVGSRGNVGVEPSPRATIQRLDLATGNLDTFAAGLRNPVGIAVYPGSDRLYTVVNERDGLGDGLVPDYLTEVKPGAFYGWPYAYIGRNPDPDYGGRRPDLVAQSVTPDLLFRSHSAPMGLVFYDRDRFPADYRGDAFVALHGSWNAADPRGYMVVRVPFAHGRPAGGYESFATGFWVRGSDRALVIGRPAGLAVAGDGSLLVADDAGGAVWRIAWTGR